VPLRLRNDIGADSRPRRRGHVGMPQASAAGRRALKRTRMSSAISGDIQLIRSQPQVGSTLTRAAMFHAPNRGQSQRRGDGGRNIQQFEHAAGRCRAARARRLPAPPSRRLYEGRTRPGRVASRARADHRVRRWSRNRHGEGKETKRTGSPPNMARGPKRSTCIQISALISEQTIGLFEKKTDPLSDHMRIKNATCSGFVVATVTNGGKDGKEGY